MGCETELVCKTHGIRFWCGYGSYGNDAARRMRLLQSKQCEIVGGSHDGSYEQDGHLYCINFQGDDLVQVENYSAMPVIHLDKWPDSDEVRTKFDELQIEREKRHQRLTAQLRKERGL